MPIERPLGRFLTLPALVLGLTLVGCGGGGSGEEGGSAEPAAAAPAAKPTGGSTPRTVQSAAASPVVSPSMTEEPPLVLDPPVLDLGVVPPNTAAEGAVMLINRGTEPLLILAAEPSCKCTTLDDIAGTTIAPGESTELRAVLDESPNIGPKTAQIKLLVDGYPVVKVVELKAEISLPVRPVPSLINAVRGQNRKGRVVVESIDGSPFSICGFHGATPTFLGFDPAADAPRSKYVLAYDLDTIAEPYPRYLVIETDHPEAPIVDIYLRHESTLPTINSNMRMSGGYRFPLGRIAAGETADIEIPFKSLARPLSTVISAHPDVRADLIGTRNEETADGIITYALVRVTPDPDFSGMLYAPLEAMTSTGDTAPFDVFGVVVPAGETCAGPSAG